MLADTTVMWHGFKWCQVKSSKQSGSEHAGWDVKCCCTTHQHMGQLVCRKHMSFRKLRGRDITERMLMWWCLHASDVATRVDHRDLILPKEEVLPSREELEAQMEALVARAAAGAGVSGSGGGPCASAMKRQKRPAAAVAVLHAVKPDQWLSSLRYLRQVTIPAPQKKAAVAPPIQEIGS